MLAGRQGVQRVTARPLQREEGQASFVITPLGCCPPIELQHTKLPISNHAPYPLPVRLLCGRYTPLLTSMMALVPRLLASVRCTARKMSSRAPPPRPPAPLPSASASEAMANESQPLLKLQKDPPQYDGTVRDWLAQRVWRMVA